MRSLPRLHRLFHRVRPLSPTFLRSPRIPTLIHQSYQTGRRVQFRIATLGRSLPSPPDPRIERLHIPIRDSALPLVHNHQRNHQHNRLHSCIPRQQPPQRKCQRGYILLSLACQRKRHPECIRQARPRQHNCRRKCIRRVRPTQCKPRRDCIRRARPRQRKCHRKCTPRDRCIRKLPTMLLAHRSTLHNVIETIAWTHTLPSVTRLCMNRNIPATHVRMQLDFRNVRAICAQHPKDIQTKPAQFVRRIHTM